ncbi:MAG: hypothetical protein KBA08_01250 [Firmicutes bacterium]|nr:hypothetical protein [Bacillota bacterium]
MTKKDLKEEKLLEEQLDRVQGGFVSGQGKNATIIYCLQPGCSWLYPYVGNAEGLAAAQQAHTNATGHNLFGPYKITEFGH